MAWFDKQIKEVLNVLQETLNSLERADCLLQELEADAEEKRDNIPENLQNSSRGELASERADNFSNIYLDFDSILESIRDLKDKLLEVE